jgi:hypothetical protein
MPGGFTSFSTAALPLVAVSKSASVAAAAAAVAAASAIPTTIIRPANMASGPQYLHPPPTHDSYTHGDYSQGGQMFFGANATAGSQQVSGCW